MTDRVTWTGLNIREVSAVCRDLLAWNAAHPTEMPRIWYTGRSRVNPEQNTVTIRTTGGRVTVRVGDTIVRRPDGSFTVTAKATDC